MKHILNKLLSARDKEKILKSAQGKRHVGERGGEQRSEESS